MLFCYPQPMRALCLLLALATPPGHGRSCSVARDCPSPMTCVKSGERRTCQIRCTPGKTKCPEDQRCVKDIDSNVCRPITDTIYTDTPEE